MRSAKHKKKKRAWIIVPAIVLVFVIITVIAAAVVWNKQKNNIEALKYANNYSNEEIAQKIEEHDAFTQEKVSEFAGKPLRPLTAEESEMLQNGELTEEQAIALIMGSSDKVEDVDNIDETINDQDVSDNNEEYSDNNEESYNINTETSTEAKSSTENSDNSSSSASTGSAANVSTLLAKVYVLKAEYTSSIDSLISQGLSEVSSLSAEERTTAKKIELMQKYTGLGASLESTCDGKMESLLAEIETELESTGGDTSIVNELRSSYEEEKRLKKAELVSKYS